MESLAQGLTLTLRESFPLREAPPPLDTVFYQFPYVPQPGTPVAADLAERIKSSMALARRPVVWNVTVAAHEDLLLCSYYM